jgi:rifampicin phosphotransferase
MSIMKRHRSNLAPARSPGALTLTAPGPGTWILDATHWQRPVTRLLESLYPRPFGRGFRDGMRRYGLLVRRPELRFLSGFVYSRIEPAPQEELPERFEAAARAFETRLWREDLRRWDEELRPASIAAHLALQRTDPTLLGARPLLAHLEACRTHLEHMIEQHHRLAPAALIPTGDFLAQGSELAGLPPERLLAALRGSSPVSAGATDGLAEAAAAVAADPEARAILEAAADPGEILARLRVRRDEVGTRLLAYLERVGCRLIDGFDVSYPRGEEVPAVLVQALRGALEPGSRGADEGAAGSIGERVPPSERARFDELLADARATYRLRDERSVYGDVWALGLLRRAVLAAGDRLAAAGRIEAPEHLLEAPYGDVVSLVADGTGPAAAELAERARFRAAHTVADAPRVLGEPPSDPPPLDGLPAQVARAMRAVGLYLHLVFADAGDDGAPGSRVVRGVAASPGVYEGTARRITGPGELDRLRRGDVLVTGATSEAFNVALPLVGAIVTDGGGLLSHAAIVAREIGIPAVVGTRVATRRIPDGARVRVDGGAGTVEPL